MNDTIATEHKEADTKVEFFDDELPCKLSNEELVKRARQSVELGRKLRQVKAEFESTKAAYKAEAAKHKAEVSGLEDERNELDHSVNVGTEERTVKCREVYIFRTNTVEVWREDTNEKVSTRAMTVGERHEQLELDGVAESQKPSEPAEPDGESATAGSADGIVDNDYDPTDENPPTSVDDRGPEPDLPTSKKGKGRKGAKGGKGAKS